MLCCAVVGGEKQSLGSMSFLLNMSAMICIDIWAIMSILAQLSLSHTGPLGQALAQNSFN